MQEVVKDLVSIIIPYYNAQNFINETIDSIESQTYQNFEIILINDGSNEKDLETFFSTHFPKIIFINKIKNSGVSDTRNIGLKKAKGEFILFLDSDDMLSINFLQIRVDILSKNSTYDFCSGNVNLYRSKNDIELDFWNNNSSQLLKDILLFNPQINTCPSSFMYKKDFLVKNKLSFNPELQSTADRYFLIEALFHQGRYVVISDPNSQLLYRVHSNSMSNTLSKSLVLDNLKYYTSLKRSNFVPKEISKEFNYKMRFILCGACKQISDWKNFVRFLLALLFNHPKKFILDTISKKV